MGQGQSDSNGKKPMSPRSHPGTDAEGQNFEKREEKDENVHSEESEDVSFNYNSESSEEDNKFPTSAALNLQERKIEDPLLAVDISLKRVPKDFIGN
jgi:hypothetical protein